MMKKNLPFGKLSVLKEQVKAVSYSSRTANFYALSMMQYIPTLFAQYTQPKYCNLLTNNRKGTKHFCEYIIYHYLYIFLSKYHA